MNRTKTNPFRQLLLFLFSHRTLALLRWDLHFLLVRFKNVLLLRRQRIRSIIAKAEMPVYLNLGSGPRGLPDRHWINVDGYQDVNVHHLMDFTRSWPFEDNSLEGIFCEHVFEHFDLMQGQALLEQSWRVLRPGQCIRIIVPDGDKIVRTYCENPLMLLQHRETETEFAMEAVNSYYRQRYEHQFIYDWPLLRHQLAKAGFEQIERVSYRQGFTSRPIMLDDERYSWESLYVEAVKPTTAT